MRVLYPFRVCFQISKILRVRCFWSYLLAKLTNLSANNIRITGPTPDSFANLSNLKEFNLDTNTLTGTIPIMIRKMTSLEDSFDEGG